MILISKFVLVILIEEPIKYGKQQEKHDTIQHNQLDLWSWPRNQAIYANDTINMGKKRHFLLEMIEETTTFMPWCWEFFSMDPCLQYLKNYFDRVWVFNTILPPFSHGGWARIWRHGRIGMVEEMVDEVEERSRNEGSRAPGGPKP